MTTTEQAFTYRTRANGAQSVFADGRLIGTVRRARALDTVNMAGRSWVASFAGRRVPGTFPTRVAAAKALVR